MQRLLAVRWISCLRGGIFAAMTSVPHPVPPSPVAVQPAPHPKPHHVMWPLAPGPFHLLETGVLILNSSPSQLLGCWSSCSPAWWVGKLVFVLRRGAAVASPPDGLNSPQSSEQHWLKSDLWVWGARGILSGGSPAAQPSFFLLSQLQPRRSHHTGLQTWPTDAIKLELAEEPQFFVLKPHLAPGLIPGSRLTLKMSEIKMILILK